MEKYKFLMLVTHTLFTIILCFYELYYNENVFKMVIRTLLSKSNKLGASTWPKIYNVSLFLEVFFFYPLGVFPNDDIANYCSVELL